MQQSARTLVSIYKSEHYLDPKKCLEKKKTKINIYIIYYRQMHNDYLPEQ